jgi:hypothetical protein
MRIGAFDAEHHALLGSTNETAKQHAERDARTAQ